MGTAIMYGTLAELTAELLRRFIERRQELEKEFGHRYLEWSVGDAGGIVAETYHYCRNLECEPCPYTSQWSLRIETLDDMPFEYSDQEFFRGDGRKANAFQCHVPYVGRVTLTHTTRRQS